MVRCPRHAGANMPAFDDARLDFIDWCCRQQERLWRRERLLQDLGFAQSNDEENSNKTAAEIAKSIAELDRLVAKFEAAALND